jgi:ribose transport system permease protein
MSAVAVDSLWTRRRASVRRLDSRPGIAWGLAIVLFVVYWLYQPDFLSRLQMQDLCAATAFLVALALGETLVILTRGIDLSLGGILSLGTAIAATQFVGPGSEVVWSIVIIAVGAAVGTLNGVLVGVLGLQPFIVTLATWSVCSGVALLVLPVQGGALPATFSNWINISSLGFPNAAWVILAMIVFWSWFKRTRLCRRIYALGSDPEGAIIAGVHPRTTLMAVYCIAGVCAAFGSILYAMLTASGDPTVGNGEILPAVTAVVVGGVSLYGGSGGFVGTVAAAFALTLIGDVVIAWNLSQYWQQLAYGIVLILVVLFGGALRSFRIRRTALAAP